MRKRPQAVGIEEFNAVDEGLAIDPPDADVGTLRRAIFAPEPNYREPLVLQTLFGYGTEEIGRMMRITQGATLTRPFRARTKLAVALMGPKRPHVFGGTMRRAARAVRGVTMKRLTRRGFFKAGGAVALAAPLVGVGTGSAEPRAWTARKRRVRVRDLEMAYYEAGNADADPIVFLHGNPTSSYLWRNVIPHVETLGRCIAPDMIGMGDSDPLPDSGAGKYTFAVNRDYMFALFEALGVTERVTLVVHDWGSGIGLSWAQAHPDKVKGLAYTEAILRPSSIPPQPEPKTGPFAIFRSPRGEQAVLRENMFVEQLLIGGLEYYLTDEDKAEYRRPYLQPGESRRPTLAWPRELPLGGKPAETERLVADYTSWLEHDERVPKLFIRANPGAILSRGPMLDFVRDLKNQREVMVYGGHYVQEVSPDAIGRILVEWIPTLPA